MNYGILLWPHSNHRYQEAIKPLGLCELLLLVGEENISSPPVFRTIAGASFLCFSSERGEAFVRERLRDYAHMFLLAEMREDGSMMPLGSQRQAYLGSDLPGILKYKGKTNEVFTRFLINLAVYSSAFSEKAGSKLRVFDPMCGRGTTLFEAVNRGYDAVGADIDRTDIHEAETFFRRYLEYHKIKHLAKDTSMTISGKKSVLRKAVKFSSTHEAFKAGDTLELSLINADAFDAVTAFPKNHFHVACIDLPYGVQHEGSTKGKRDSLPALLQRILPALRERLIPGGAVALSFNVHSISRDELRLLMEKCGFRALSGGLYDGLEHWVEQAVTRDAVVGIRDNAP